MLSLALNLLALLIVLGLCWGAMMWLGGRFHGQFSEADQRAPVFPNDILMHRALNQPCAVCEGVGAQQVRGRLSPCPECLGTGVLSPN